MDTIAAHVERTVKTTVMGALVWTLCKELSHPITNLDNYCTISNALLFWLLLSCDFSQYFLPVFFLGGQSYILQKENWVMMTGLFLAVDKDNNVILRIYFLLVVVLWNNVPWQ